MFYREGKVYGMYIFVKRCIFFILFFLSRDFIILIGSSEGFGRVILKFIDLRWYFEFMCLIGFFCIFFYLIKEM